MPAVLQAERLTKSFGGLIAVNEVNLLIEENHTTGIIGPNGSGKTTFFNLLSGFFPPTSGRILFYDQDVTSLPPNQRVLLGMSRTFQLVSVFNSMTVWENLVLPGVRFDREQTGLFRFLFNSAQSRRIRDHCAEVLKVIGLEKEALQPTATLSYGSKRMLEIGIALSLKPRLLLLDEPLAGLSDYEIAEVLQILHRIKKDLTLVIIEHKVSKILDMVDRLCVLNEGHLISDGEPARVLDEPAVRECYWGKEDIDQEDLTG